jgi:enamine deaminase RidA (YjgF/YER057c/UK114 family)
MTTNPEYLTPNTLMPPVGYSHIAKTNGLPLAYIAGQVLSCDASGKLVGEGNFRAQVEQTFANVKIAVEAAGGSMGSLIKLNYYCVESVEPREQVAVRDVRDKYVNVEKPPASTFVVVSRLARPGWLIEIEAVVAIPAA